MTHETLAKSGTEAAHQTALFAWAAVACQHGFAVAWDWAKNGQIAFKQSSKIGVPELKWLHHIPNGGSRGDDAKSRAIRGSQMKAQGVRQGVADIFLPVVIRQHVMKGCDFCDNGDETEVVWSGLYIEMKKPSEKPVKATSKGGVSDDQAEFGAFVQSQGFGWCVCYSWEEAAHIIEQYMEQGA